LALSQPREQFQAGKEVMMTTVIEAVYEDGVFKPLAAVDLKEQGHYRLILQEVTPEASELDQELEAELARRTTVLPDGRKIVNMDGVLAPYLRMRADEEADRVAETLEELRRDRARRFDEEADESSQSSPEA
jgi:predicted DNA-binding antitoxin AbrB/MazE fold protein